MIKKTDGLRGALARIEAAGGETTRPIFEFLVGRRFHFRHLGGNELSAWAE